jgi:hypothetical protein
MSLGMFNTKMNVEEDHLSSPYTNVPIAVANGIL